MLEGLRKAGWEARPPADAARDLAPTSHHEAERRQITAMSCELIGIAGAFQHCVSEVVDRHGGFIARDLGNTVLVVFGYPAAHEHDAERAVRAGLELCAAITGLRSTREAPTRCRVGIATGMVIIGDATGVGEAWSREIVGDTPDLAVRLQMSAQPDRVVIDPVTRRLLGDLFDCRDLDAIEIRPGAEPTRRWQVLGESTVASRFEALRGPALSPLVGREEEIDLLLRRCARA